MLIDASRDKVQSLPYKACAVVDTPPSSHMSFRQEQGLGICSIENGQLCIRAPPVSMTVQGVLHASQERDLPTDAASLKFGIIQLLVDSSCRMYFGKSQTSLDYYQDDYFSVTEQSQNKALVSDLPLIDKITDNKQEQKQTDDRSDPAYSKYATSPALLEDVFKNQNVYCQLSMQDQPETGELDIEIPPSDSNPKLYLNRVEKRCLFRTMISIYKPGFGSKEVYPLYAVDWHFNVVATRHPNAKPNEIFKLSPLTPKATHDHDFIAYPLGKTPSFDFSSLTKIQIVEGKKIFESPNNVHKWSDTLVPVSSSSPVPSYEEETFV